MATIEIQGLTKRFGDVAAVDDLSFSAREGAVTGFLGPNGAGKSTTLRMLLGLVNPTAGTATIDGKPYAAPRRSRSATSARCSRPTPSIPAGEQRDHLRVLAAAAGLPLARVDAVLDEVDLADAGHRRVKGFSLGMRQRLGLAERAARRARRSDPRRARQRTRPGRSPLAAAVPAHVRRRRRNGARVEPPLAEVAQTVDDVVIIAQRPPRHPVLARRPDAALAGGRAGAHSASRGAARRTRRRGHRRRAGRGRHGHGLRDHHRRSRSRRRRDRTPSSTR